MWGVRVISYLVSNLWFTLWHVDIFIISRTHQIKYHKTYSYKRVVTCLIIQTKALTWNVCCFLHSARQHLKREKRHARGRSNSNSSEWDARARSPILFAGPADTDEPVNTVIQREYPVATVHRPASPDVVILPRIGNPSSAVRSTTGAARISPIATDDHASAFRNNVSRINTSESAASTSTTVSAPHSRSTGKLWVRRRAKQLMRRQRKQEKHKQSSSVHLAQVHV